MKLRAIEGNTQRLDGGAMYGNAPRTMWETWSPPDEKHRIALACRALLLETDDGRSILFEAGIGAFFDPKMRERFGVVESEHILAKNLEAVGTPHDEIDAVVLSHLHFDHAGGILSAFDDGPPRLLFPNAKFYVGADHWARAKVPHTRDRASFVSVLNALLEASGRVSLVDAKGESDLSPLVTFRFSNGHTPGLMLSQINLASGPVVFVADLIPGMPWVHAPITMGYDRYPELLVDEKTALLADLAARDGKVFFTHDPKDACALVKRHENGRFFAERVDVASLS
jgi:glyoxylase-like metal-dependent hydrolase (beta-lactamase superfamily II)